MHSPDTNSKSLAERALAVNGTNDKGKPRPLESNWPFKDGKPQKKITAVWFVDSEQGVTAAGPFYSSASAKKFVASSGGVVRAHCPTPEEMDKLLAERRELKRQGQI